MAEVQIKGVAGSTLTVDDEAVTFFANSGAARIALGSAERRIALADITDRAFKAANIAVNGHIEVATVDGKSIFRFPSGGAARAAKEAFDLIVQLTPNAGVETASRGFTPRDEVQGHDRVAIDPVKAEQAQAKASAKAAGAEMKAVAKAERAEVKQEARDAKEQARRERAAEILANYGVRAARQTFGGSTVEIYDKGFVRVSAFVSDSTAFEELRSISYSRTVQGKSAGGRAAAAMMTGGLSLLASNEKRETFLSIATSTGVRTLKATGSASESTGLNLEAAGKGVLDALRAQSSGSPAATQAPTAADPTDHLVKLAQLHAQGILSDDEFAKAKAKALGI